MQLDGSQKEGSSQRWDLGSLVSWAVDLQLILDHSILFYGLESYSN